MNQLLIGKMKGQWYLAKGFLKHHYLSMAVLKSCCWVEFHFASLGCSRCLLIVFFSIHLDYLSGLKISVKVLSLSFQAGLAGECHALCTDDILLVLTSLYYCFCNLELFQDFWLCALSMSSPPSHVEPFYGTICLYNRERREKLSEDFYFRHAPTEKKDVSYKINITFSPSNFIVCPLLRHMLWLKTFLLPVIIFGEDFFWTSWNLLFGCSIIICLSANPVREACHRRRRGYTFSLFS